MARFNGIPIAETGGGSFGGIPVEEDVTPKSRSVLDIVSGGIGSLSDTASDSVNAVKSGIGALFSQTGTVLDDPAAFGKMALTSVGDVALTGAPRLASAVSRWAGGSGELPLGIDRGAQGIHELFSPAYDKYGRELAQARKQADAEGGASSVLRSMGGQVQEDARAALSPEAQARNAEYDKTTGFGALGYLATHPGKAVDMTLENLPSQGPLMGAGYAGGVLMRNIAGRAASEAGAAALKEAALSPSTRYAQVLGTPAQKAAAEAAAQAGATKSAQAAAENAIATASPYLTALNIGGEISMTVAQAADAIHQSVQKAKPEDLASLPLYQQYLSETGNDKDARALLAARLTAEWAPVAGMGTTFGSVVTGGARAEAMALAGQVSGYKQAAKGVGKEMLEEAIQNPLEDLAQHQAQIQVDPTDTYDPIKSSIEGAVVSMGHSGAVQFAKPIKDSISRIGQRGQDGGQDGGGNTPAGGTSSSGESISAGEVLGAAPQQSESDKALYTPKSLTALDRVDEIDREIGKLDTTAPEQKTKADELVAERDHITETWPKAVPGAKTTFSTETGARLDAQYALMDAGDLTTSHDESLRPVPTYPTELQPRERERHASEMQVQSIVQKLDPARLGESADVATGAPIVGADGLVESGNARTIALKRVYQANGQKAIDYKQFLKDNAARFGITSESVDALQKPVLVRVRTTPVNRAEFARQANASTVARMSPSEQARSDAAAIDNMDDLNPDDNGDFVSGSSRLFVRRFLAKLPGTEQAGLIDGAGALSQAGYTRIRNAVLAKAYGDSPVLLRMTESLDDNTRNISKALLRVAPAVAKLRESIAEGALHAADITPDLVAAVEHLSSLREKGVSVEQDMAQTGMFGDKLSPEGRSLLGYVNEHARSPRRIAEFVQAYMDALTAAGSPKQNGLFGETAAPAKSDLLTAAKKATNVEPIQSPAAVNDEGGAKPAGEASNQDGASAAGTADQGRAAAAEDFAAALDDLGVIARKHSGAARMLVPESTPDLLPTMTRLFGAAIRMGYHDAKKAIEYVKNQLKKDKRFKALWNKIAATTYLRAMQAAKEAHGKAVVAQTVAAVDDLFAEPAATNTDSGQPDLFAPPSTSQPKADDWVNFDAESGTLGIPRADMPQVKLAKRQQLYAHLEKMGITHTKEDVAADTLKPSQAEYSPSKAHNAKELEGNKAEVLVSSDGYVLDGHHRWLSRALLHESVPVVRFSAPIKELIAVVRKFPGATKNPESAGQVVTAENYNTKRDNYKPPLPPEFMTQKQLDYAQAYIDKYYVKVLAVKLSEEDRVRAEALLTPLMEKAAEAKPGYDQKIINIAKRSGAIGQMLTDIKSIGRAAIKLVSDYQFDTSEMKDILRSTIVVNSYADAQAVLDDIAKEFDVFRIKDKTQPQARDANGGYSDVTVFVKMPNGALAEIQINVPEMLSIKEYQGHKLYEAARDQNHGSPERAELYSAMREIYDAAFAFVTARVSLPVVANSTQPAAQDKKVDSVMGAQADTFGNPSRALSVSPSSESLKTLPSGNSTNSSPSKDAQNLEPAGNLSGTFISTTSNESIAKKAGEVYTPNEGGKSSEHAKPDTSGTQGKEPGAAAATEADGQAAGVRVGSGGRDNGSAGNAGARNSGQAGTQQDAGTAVPGKGGDTEHGGQAGNGNRPKRNATVPAGRDIPAKSGRNFRFGDGDLTYAGSNQTKARQNVEAVELLKKLETEGRQATREEQSTLAKFIGWGSSEIANTLFGDKLDKKIAALGNYKEALEAFDDLKPGAVLNHYDRGYYTAYSVISAKNDKFNYRDPISKADLQKAKPDTSSAKWGELRDRLKAALTQEEWDAASRSTQYAHFTGKSVARPMLAVISKMGFKGGTILEPGAGIGVFPGLMSADMAANSVYTGIEFDPITGGILKQLFPDERILVESFVDSKLPEDFYDIAFGNPPFAGNVKVLADPKYAKMALVLHDYFFAKTIDSVKPGGLVVFISSRYTMDKKDDKARAYMADRADLVGAIRLPQTAFQKNAGTEVVTDVLFLRKKVPGEAQFADARAWAGLAEVTTPEGKYMVNEYFAAHPEMVLGDHSGKGSMYGKKEYTVLAREGDIEAQFAAATERLPANIFVEGRGTAAEAARVRDMDFNPKAKKEGSFYVTDAGVLMQRERGVGVRAEEKFQKNAAVLKDFIKLRDAVKQSQFDQLNDGDWEGSLKTLQKAYAYFVKRNGKLHQHTGYLQKVKVDEIGEDGEPTGQKVMDEEQRYRFPLLNKIADDPEYTLVMALENLNEDSRDIAASDWLTKRTLGAPVEPDIKTPSDALLATLNDTGNVDIPAIAERMGISDQEAIDALGTLIYESPTKGWSMADEYLSGNVKKKLAQAEEALKSDKRYARNVEALKAVQPAPKSSADITPQIGMNWIPGAIYEQFLQELSGVKVKVEYIERAKEWHVVESAGGGSPRATVDWGVGDRANATWILEKALTGAPIRLTMAVSDGHNGTKLVFDPVRSEAANQKRSAMREEFRKWMFQDAERTTILVQMYNDKFNTTVQRKFDGSHLTLPGTSKLFTIFDHVKRGAWRIIQTGNTYLAHAVGAGKTFEMVISAMEQKRLGKIKKPMIIVPGHMLQQFTNEWQQLYPTARLMVADEKDFHTDNRRRFVSRVAMSDLDGVIMTHSSFGLLDLDPAFKQKMIEQELEVMRASYEEAGGDLDDIGDKKVRKDPKIKRIESQIEKLEQQLEKAMSGEGKDKNVRFDEMGVDFLYVDEAHMFRKLSYATSRQMKGIDPAGSQRAWDLYMKARWLAEKTPGRSLVFASGTPITNTTAELYTVQRFMAPHILEENGLSSFDDWASQFGEESTEIESTSSGKYEPVTRFSKFVNLSALTQMFRDFADVLTEDQLAALLGDKRPKVAGGGRKMIISPRTKAYSEFQENVLRPRIATSKAWKPSFDEPYNHDPIIAINIDARLAAIDMRFMDPSQPNDPDSKLNWLIDGVIREYKKSAQNEYKDRLGNVEQTRGATQMVFFESGFGRMVAQRRGFSARSWMEKRLREAGIPIAQVAFMEDYKKSVAKLKLFKDVNAGKVRILVGSSAAMGTGVNAQQRLLKLHHLDAPQVPAVLEQREGRIVRQGNKNPEVGIDAYAMKGSFDENPWSTLARKQFFVGQALSGDPNLNSIEDVSEVSQMEMAAGLVADNPYVMQLAGARSEVEKLNRLYTNHEEQRARMRNDYTYAGRLIDANESLLPAADKLASGVEDLSGDNFKAKAGKEIFEKRKEWGEAILAKFKELSDKLTEDTPKVGEISGFDVRFVGGMLNNEYRANLVLKVPGGLILAHDALESPVSVSMRAANALVALTRAPVELRKEIEGAKARRDALVSRLDAPFPLAEQLASKVKEAAELEKLMLAYTEDGAEVEQELTDEGQQKTGAITPMFSRGSGRGMAMRDLQAVADRVSKGFKNLPRVHVMSSPADLSTKDATQKALRDFIRKQDAWNDVEGATHEGEIYLFASGMADEARAEHVLATHELTHYGLRGSMGKDMDSALQHVLLMNAKVRKAAVALREKNGLASNLEAVEEVLADIPTADLAKLRGWRKVVQVVRNWLNKAGAKALAARLDKWLNAGLTEQQQADLFVADLVTAAREWVKTGKGGSGVATMGGTRLAEQKLADDLAGQEKWLAREAKARGYQSIDELAEKNYPAFENLAALWRNKHPVEGALLSRAATAQQKKTPEQLAEDIIQQKAATPRPLEALVRVPVQAMRLDKLTMGAYNKAGALLDRFTPETIKAGLVSDYGVPEAVSDHRITSEARQKQQIRATGALMDKLSMLTRAESRVAYEWMNSADPQSAEYFREQLPPESIKVMAEVEKMIDHLSQEAVKLGQLDPESFKTNRFSYLHRSYAKHTAELTKGETASRQRAISILGDQYKGRGMTDAADMTKIKNGSPEWWNRKTQQGKADKGLKGAKLLRLERRANAGEGTLPLEGMGDRTRGRLLEVAYWPSALPIPARYESWNQAGTWEVRDTKGPKLILWRDFTKQERVALGEIDEVRYAIGKTLHGMIHDVETGRYLQWLGQNYAKKEGEEIPGVVVEASDRMRDTFKPGEWVKVPESMIPGTKVKKYGNIAGRYLPGPIWNDVRQSVGFRYAPLGDTYAAIHRAWKTSKTALSPAVHINNVMANVVMADWHDVTAGHVLKALKLMASKDAAAAEVLIRFGDSGASIGSWATKELQMEQLRPLLDALEKELGIAGNVSGQVGVMSALQLMLKGRLPSAWDAFKPTTAGKVTVKAARAMLDLYEAEDQVFRLAVWLKAKEEGATDGDAGKLARKSFLDYHINAPWVQMMRNTALPFVSFTYRAVPMLLETAAKKPWKMIKLGLVAGAINALGYMLSGGGEDDERKLLPEEKAGRVWGITPKLIRMPWNDKNGSPVFLDVRRFIPVGDIFDTGQSHSALPLLPSFVPGGPLAVLAELAFNSAQFTGKDITLETDTKLEKAQKIADHLYKAMAPNIAILPGTYAWTSIVNAGTGKTDTFGREQSLTQAVVSSIGIKLGSYPNDVLRLNAQREAQFKMMEIDRNITALKREYQKHGITADQFQAKATDQMDKKRKVVEDLQKRL